MIRTNTAPIRPLVDAVTRQIRDCVPAHYTRADVARRLKAKEHTGGQWDLGGPLSPEDAITWRKVFNAHHDRVDAYHQREEARQQLVALGVKVPPKESPPVRPPLYLTKDNRVVKEPLA